MKKFIVFFMVASLYAQTGMSVTEKVLKYFEAKNYGKVISLLSNRKQLSEKLKFFLGLSYLKQKKYKKAHEIFKELFNKHMNNIKYNFYLGITAAKLKKYKEAIAAFDRILIYDPNNIYAKIELAKVYIGYKEYIVAREYLISLKNEVKNKELLAKINKYIKFTDLMIKRHFYKTYLMLGIGYDSNIYNRPLSDTFDININGSEYNVNNTTPHKRVVGFVKALIFKHGYLADKFIYSDNILLYSKTYPAASDNNILFLRYSPEFKFKRKTFAPFFAYLKYGKDPLLNQFGFDYKYIFNRKNTLGFNFTYNNYILEKNDQKDSKSITLYDKYTNKNNILTLKMKLQRKIKGNDPSVDYNSYGFIFERKIKKNKYMFKPGVSFDLKNYLYENALFNEEQLDRKYTAFLKVEKTIKKNLLQFEIKRVYNYSNIEVYKYKKWLIGLNIIIPLFK